MTHSGGKSHNVGDKGQRYEVLYYPRGESEPKVYGWSNTYAGAEMMLEGIKLWPAAEGGRIHDRETDHSTDGKAE